MIGKDCVVDVDPACEVLDVGAGSGVIGRLLKEKQGFSNITAIEPSEGMLVKLRETGAYKADRRMYLGLGVDKYPDDLKGKFDVVIASGSFLAGHIPDAGFDDVHASLKTNGYFVTALRSSYWAEGQKEGYRAKCEGLFAAGKLKLVHTANSYREEWRPREGSEGEQIESILLVMQRVD